eukprot:jgi/Botrbrau1/3174/Bobra.37_2s0004.1
MDLWLRQHGHVTALAWTCGCDSIAKWLREHAHVAVTACTVRGKIVKYHGVCLGQSCRAEFRTSSLLQLDSTVEKQAA